MASSGTGKRCDADILLAAGWASCDPRRELGLRLWRYNARPSDEQAAWLVQRSLKLLAAHIARQHPRQHLNAAQREAIVHRTLTWIANGGRWSEFVEDDGQRWDLHRWLADEYAHCVRLVFSSMALHLRSHLAMR